MKGKNKLIKILFSASLTFPTFSGISVPANSSEKFRQEFENEKIIKKNIIDNQIKLKFEAEFLYNKLKNIMKEFYTNPMSQMENECKKIMSSKSTVPNFLNECDFEEKSKKNLILYRGMENSNISNDFFNGKVYFSASTNNIRGTGVYTTTSKKCAEYYSDKSPSTLATMFISKENSKILENDRLQRIKNIMKENHPDEFSRFDGKSRDTFINDSAKLYLDNRFNEEVKLWAKRKGIEKPKEEIMAKLDEDSIKEISEKIKNDPETKKVLSAREKFFEDPESFCWYNDGLLTFLLGYDALH